MRVVVAVSQQKIEANGSLSLQTQLYDCKDVANQDEAIGAAVRKSVRDYPQWKIGHTSTMEITK